MKVYTAHTQVQGMDAPDQIMRALAYFNERSDVDMIAILRGGGSADDLSCFNDEALARAVAASRIPVITGIGHEVDETLCDLVADVRASTPSNAAEMLTPDRTEKMEKIRDAMRRCGQAALKKIEWARENNVGKVEKISQSLMLKYIDPMLRANTEKLQQLRQKIQNECVNLQSLVANKMRILEALNPEKVLKQGYAILAGKISPGNVVKITTFEKEIKAEIKEVYDRKS